MGSEATALFESFGPTNTRDDYFANEYADALSFTRQMVTSMLTPSFIMAALLKYHLFSYMCVAASADLCMYLIFEIMDDDVKERNKKGEEQEDQTELFENLNELVGK